MNFFPFLKKQKTKAIPHIGLCQNFWPLSVQRTNDCKLKLLHSGNLSVERNPETTFQALRYVIDSGIAIVFCFFKNGKNVTKCCLRLSDGNVLISADLRTGPSLSFSVSALWLYNHVYIIQAILVRRGHSSWQSI